MKIYAISDSTKSTFPIVKKISAEALGSDAKVSVTISMIAVNTPPSACPETTAVTYSGGNWPHIPKIETFSERIIKLNSVSTTIKNPIWNRIKSN